MSCRCCIVEILDGNSDFASLRRVCFAGAAHSPYGSLFPAKSDGERNGRNGRRLGRRRANDYYHGAFGQRYAKSRGGNGSGRWFCQSQGNGFCQALSDAPAREGAACPCVVVVLTIGAGFMPVRRDKDAEVYANAQLERIEQVKAEETPVLSKEEKKVFLEAAKALEKDLKTAKTKKAAEEAVREAQQNMKQLEKESVSKDLKELAETLKQEENTAALSEALEQGDEASISQAMEQLLQKMAAMDKGQAASLAQQLAEAAENISDEELQEALKALEEALENGADPSEASEALKNALLSQAQVNSALRSSLQKLNRNVGQQSLAKKVEGEGESTGGEGQGESGQGNSGQTGSGGSGTAGVGNGGQGRGFGHAEPEKIYTRSAAGKDGYDAQLKGTDSDEGQTTITEHRTMGQAGTSVPYDTVYGQYRNEAMETLENSSVPYGMRELVSDYFATLER